MKDIFYRVNDADFETFEEAEARAEETGAEVIEEIGGAWDEFRRCGFCGEWFPDQELNGHGDCERCAAAIRDHGGY